MPDDRDNTTENDIEIDNSDKLEQGEKGSKANSSDAEVGYQSYLKQIQNFPMLDAEEEYTLVKKWQEKNNQHAAEKIVNSHLRLVAKIAAGYSGYGMPLSDLISEGVIGIMHALNRFDAQKGARFSTYASWWIKASMKDYIMRTWSMVRIGTTSAQKKLFYGLRRTKGELSLYSNKQLSPQEVKEIAEIMKVSDKDVVEMNRRMGFGNDYSLNTPMSHEGDSGEWLDWLVDDTPDQETRYIVGDEYNRRMSLLEHAFEFLTPREYEIIQRRHLQEKSETLADIADKMNISRERVRQIEVKAFEKLERAIKRKASEERLLQ